MTGSYVKWFFVHVAVGICLLGAAEYSAAKNPPHIISLTCRPVPFNVESGLEVMPKLIGHTDTGVTLSYRWFVEEEEVEGQKGPLLSGKYFQRGDRISVEVTPELGGKLGRPVRSEELEVGNAPPRFVSSPPASLTADGYSYQLEVVDADDDVLSYQLLEAPTGMQIDSETGLLNWVAEQWPTGPIAVTVAVEDGYGGHAEQQFTMNPTFKIKGPSNE